MFIRSLCKNKTFSRINPGQCESFMYIHICRYGKELKYIICVKLTSVTRPWRSHIESHNSNVFMTLCQFFFMAMYVLHISRSVWTLTGIPSAPLIFFSARSHVCCLILKALSKYIYEYVCCDSTY